MTITNAGWTELPTEEEIQNSFDGLDDCNTVEEFNASIDAAIQSFYVNPLELDVEVPEPCFMEDSAGEFMFSPSSVVNIFGEPGARKSFLLQTAIARHYGIMMQMESSPQGLVQRLRDLGFPKNAYARYTFPQSRNDVLEYVEAWVNIPPTIIGIDSMAHLASNWGADTNSDSDVQKIFRQVLHPLRDAGHCVVFLDHVPKSSKNNGYATGSQNKKAQSDIALRIDKSQKTGEHRLYVTKDRDNIYGKRGIDNSGFYGFLEISENPARVQIKRLSGETSASPIFYEGSGQITQRHRRESLVKYLQENGPTGKEELRKHVGGNSLKFTEMLTAMVIGGAITSSSGLDYNGKQCRALITLA
jgi:hypothetical protein